MPCEIKPHNTFVTRIDYQKRQPIIFLVALEITANDYGLPKFEHQYRLKQPQSQNVLDQIIYEKEKKHG